MKRSDFFIRLTTGILFLAVASYIGILLYNAVVNVFVTTTAMSYAIEETLPAKGFIVRTETVLTESGSMILPVVREGERVASGQAVAVEYLSREALETASEIRSIQLRLDQLEAAGSGRAVQAARLESVMNLSMAVIEGDLRNLDEMALNVQTLVFTSDTLPITDVAALQDRLDALRLRSEGIRTISAPFAGTFSQVVDGFEHIDPSDIRGLTPDNLELLFTSPSNTHRIGKLVTSFTWHFAAIMDADDAMELSVGRQVPIQFAGAFHDTKHMLVENIGTPEDGRSVVIFSSDRSLHDAVALRGVEAEIILDVISGIRVPMEALRLDDNATTYIYLQTGMRAERVNVEIISEHGDVLLVRDGVESGTPLRAGSTIIVRANNLYHGKIIG